MVSEFDQQFSESAAPLLAKQFGVLVQLLRTGSSATATFTCAFAAIVDEVEIDDEALGTAVERRTWWPLKADTIVEPRAGDILQLVADDETTLTGEQHEIAPNGSDKAVEEHPDGVTYVVRTKRVA